MIFCQDLFCLNSKFWNSAVRQSQLLLAAAETKGKRGLQSQNNLLFAVPESDRPDSASRTIKVRLNIICFPQFLVSSVVFHIINLSIAEKYSFYLQLPQKPWKWLEVCPEQYDTTAMAGAHCTATQEPLQMTQQEMEHLDVEHHHVTKRRPY